MKEAKHNLDCFIDPTAECWTDHQLVILKQNFPLQSKRFHQKSIQPNRQTHRSKSIHPAKLIKSVTLREKMGEALETKFQQNPIPSQNCNVTKRYQVISENIQQICNIFLKPPKRKNQYWFDNADPQIEHLLERRRICCQHYLQVKTEKNKFKYQQAKKEVRKALRTMENRFWKEQAQQMQLDANKGNTHAYYKALKQIYGPNKTQKISQKFQKKDGTLTTTTDEALERLREYYSELLNRKINVSHHIEQYLSNFQKPIAWELDETPTIEELFKIMSRMKNHKATSLDPIPIEIFKYIKTNALSTELSQLLTECWETSQVPEIFLVQIMTSLFKKGNRTMPENQRGISMISHLSKSLVLLCSNRISAYCEKQDIFPESACGFRPKRSTVDMILTARLLQYSCKEKGISLFLAFIDIAKAYDSVHRETLWKILSCIGIPPKILSLLKTLYGKNKCKVKLNSKFSNFFMIEEGLKQGCPAACLLFNIFFAIIIHIIKMKLDQKGIELKFRLDGDVFNLQRLYAKTKVQKKQLLEMIFADDIAICATSEQELQTIISVFYYTFKEFGLQMNLKKTEILHQKSSTEHENKEASNIEIEGKELLVVSEFKYLGTLISDKATLDVEIQARINKATTAFWKLYQRVWKKKHLTLLTKAQTYKTMILPCLTYACESWAWTAKHIRKLETTHFRFLRIIAGKSWRDHISYIELLNLVNKNSYNGNFEWADETNKISGITSIETYCRLARLRYFGHLMRMPPTRLPKIMLHGEVDLGKRKIGRPKKSYLQSVRDDLKLFNLWNSYQKNGQFQKESAENRLLWRRQINKAAQDFQAKWENNRTQCRKNQLNLSFQTIT